MSCIFCESTEYIAENGLAYAIYDKYAVTPGHVLIIPKRHVEDCFSLTQEEEVALWSLLKEVKAKLQEELKADGWNIGINEGVAAGQTILHLHIHLIPRYFGDVERPEGGVRGVIPERQKYGIDKHNL